MTASSVRVDGTHDADGRVRASAEAVQSELESRYVVRGKRSERVVVTERDVDAKRAIHARECEGCEIEIGSGVTCAKVFLESCARCEVRFRGRAVSEHLEVWHCEELTVRFENALGTTQVDQSKAVRLEYANERCMSAVVFATSEDVRVRFGGDENTSKRLDAEDLAPGDHREIPQFITRFVDGQLLTERLIRGKDEYPTTERELRASLGDQLAEEHLDTAPARAELRKDKGNLAFKDGNFAQAAVHYTEAIDLDPTHVVALCNRAQCFLKLGDHDRALADADSCIDIKSDYIKAHFRRGLALHALARYPEAIRAFERTLELDPSNAQAKDAVRFAELMARKQAAAR